MIDIFARKILTYKTENVTRNIYFFLSLKIVFYHKQVKYKLTKVFSNTYSKVNIKRNTSNIHSKHLIRHPNTYLKQMSHKICVIMTYPLHY